MLQGVASVLFTSVSWYLEQGLWVLNKHPLSEGMKEGGKHLFCAPFMQLTCPMTEEIALALEGLMLELVGQDMHMEDARKGSQVTQMHM